MNGRLKILILEPSVILTTGLVHLLGQTGLFDVSGVLLNDELIDDYLRRLRPDVLLMNPEFLTQSSEELWQQRFDSIPAMAIVALVYQYFRPRQLEPFAYQLDVTATQSQMADLLQQAHEAAHEAFDEHTVGGPQVDTYELSDREIQILVLVAQGLMTKEIADRLHITVNTVNTHRKNISRKTGIKSVAGLTVYAVTHGYIN